MIQVDLWSEKVVNGTGIDSNQFEYLQCRLQKLFYLKKKKMNFKKWNLIDDQKINFKFADRL